MKHEIEIEGLPEGWKATKITLSRDTYNEKSPDLIIYEADVRVEKIQPHRRLVLEETDSKDCDMAFHDTDGKWSYWHEVKENEVPLTNEDSNLKIGDIFYTLPKTKDKSWRGVDFECVEIREDCVKAMFKTDDYLNGDITTLRCDLWEFKKK